MGKGQNSVLDGTDLILSVEDVALGFSSNCKINTQAETGERLTKEARGGKWKEKYIKGFSEDISAEGCILTDGGEDMPTYDQLKDMMLRGEPVTAQYSVRDGDKRTGKTAGGYRGNISLPPSRVPDRSERMPNTASNLKTVVLLKK